MSISKEKQRKISLVRSTLLKYFGLSGFSTNMRIGEKIAEEMDWAVPRGKKSNRKAMNRFYKSLKPKGGGRHKRSSSRMFYKSDEWISLRIRLYKEFPRTCMKCGAQGADGHEIHADHIKPRSKYSDLELSYENLQVLCKKCNMGKSNLNEVDYRGLIRDIFLDALIP